MQRVLTIDLETSVNNEDIGKQLSSPYHEDNRIVAMGVKVDTNPVTTLYYKASVESLKDSMLEESMRTILSISDTTIMVGHNIKFDLLYLWVKCPDIRKIMYEKEIKIFDTQLAEYLLTGQNHLYPSLDDTSVKYGGVLKDEMIKAYWKEGVKTEDIPKEQLLDYLKSDVENTYLVFNQQVLKIVENDMLPFVMTQMEALLATTEMEYNGLYFNKDTANQWIKLFSVDESIIESRAWEFMRDAGIPNPNTNSNVQIGLVLFGGEYTYTTPVAMKGEDGLFLVYKTGAKKGQVKYKNTDITITIPRLVEPLEEWKNKRGEYNVGDEVLSNFTHLPFVKDIISLRWYNKEINTYLSGYSKLVWPKDKCIHHNLNHVSTATGRLSSSQPNMQNVTSAGG